MFKIIFYILILISITLPSFAYLGPGVGGGLILATLGIVFAIFALLFGLIWFPIKRLIKKRKKNKDNFKN